MTQKDAVFNAILAVFSNNNIIFQVGLDNANEKLSKPLRVAVTDTLVEQLNIGQVELSSDARNKMIDDAALRSYVSSLITNWLRKDVRLNGGVKHKASNRSPKAITSDPQLKALQQLLSAQTDQNKRIEIQTHIDQRLSQLGQ